jgi:hypothetical protein
MFWTCGFYFCRLKAIKSPSLTNSHTGATNHRAHGCQEKIDNKIDVCCRCRRRPTRAGMHSAQTCPLPVPGPRNERAKPRSFGNLSILRVLSASGESREHCPPFTPPTATNNPKKIVKECRFRPSLSPPPLPSHGENGLHAVDYGGESQVWAHWASFTTYAVLALGAEQRSSR